MAVFALHQALQLSCAMKMVHLLWICTNTLLTKRLACARLVGCSKCFANPVFSLKN